MWVPKERPWDRSFEALRERGISPCVSAPTAPRSVTANATTGARINDWFQPSLGANAECDGTKSNKSSSSLRPVKCWPDRDGRIRRGGGRLEARIWRGSTLLGSITTGPRYRISGSCRS